MASKKIEKATNMRDNGKTTKSMVKASITMWMGALSMMASGQTTKEMVKAHFILKTVPSL
jgi:hypothetical protein